MDYILKSLSDLDDRSLEGVALLHQSVMHNLLADLGLPILLRYYQIARIESSVISFCAVSSSTEILGWAIGSPDPYALNARIQKPFVGFLKQMMALAVKRPLILLQLFSSVLSSSQENLPANTVELTYIGVAKNVEGQGIGRALLNVFIEASKSSGYHSVELTTETDNLHALALYEKSGFAIKRTFQEGRFKRYRMERKLSA